MCIEPSSVLTFIQRFYQKRLTTVHTHIHKPTAESTTQADSRWSGAVRMRRLAQGHLHTQLGGAGDQTGKLQVTTQPALPPELCRPSFALFCSVQRNNHPMNPTPSHNPSSKLIKARYPESTQRSTETKST